MNNYLFFRTDRIGDFLVSAILMKSIKKNNKHSHLTVIASQKNYFYMKTLDFIDEVHLYPSGLLKKIFFFYKLNQKKYTAIFALDGKKRSIYFSIFLKSKMRFLMTTKKLFKKIFNSFFDKIYIFKESSNKLDEIKHVLDEINLPFQKEDINFLLDSDIKSKDLNLSSNYFIFHFDEKWIHKDYIKKYTSIEPSFENLYLFIEKLSHKLNKDLVITTGTKNNELLDKLIDKANKISENLYEIIINKKKVQLYVNISFFDLKYIIKNCAFIITCHGASTHLASAFNKKIYDIFEKSQKDFYNKWNSHIQNYSYFYRENFERISEKILLKL